MKRGARPSEYLPIVVLGLVFVILPTVTEGAVHVENGVAHTSVCSGSYVGGFCDREFYTDVTFSQPYDSIPTVFVTPNTITDSLGACVGASMDSLNCHPGNVTKNGFRLYCSGSPQGDYCGEYGGWWVTAGGNWIAMDTDNSVLSDHGIVPGSCSGSLVGGLCSAIWQKDITFRTPFQSAPNVLVSPEHVSDQGGCIEGTTDTVICYPSNITASGFRLSCGGSPAWDACGAYAGYISFAAAGWIAKASTPSEDVQSGHGIETKACDGLRYSNGVCYGNYYRDVTFPRPFANTPKVIVSPEHVSAGPACAGGGTDGIFCQAADVTSTGFRAYCWGSPQYGECNDEEEGKTTQAMFGYLAISELDGALSCSITFDQNPVSGGNSTTMQWTSSGANLFYINNVGYVGASGSATVSPSYTTDFSGYVSNSADGGGDATYCPATLRVNQPDTNCPIGTHLVNGVCVVDVEDDDGPPSDNTPDDTPDTTDTTDEPGNCTIGYVYQDGACIFTSCPIGYVKQGTACVFQGCPVGYSLQNGACVWSGCPDGFFQQGQQCVLENQCTSLPYCSGKDLRNGCTHELIQTCQWGCSGGACRGVPAPTAALSASPAVVKKGQSTKLSWNSSNTVSCTVTGGNGDSFTGLAAVGKVSGPLNVSTVFTLRCEGHEGSSPAYVEKKVSVSVRADWSEE